MPVSVLIALTLAPDTVAPLASFTVPEILALTLAKDVAGESRKTIRATTIHSGTPGQNLLDRDLPRRASVSNQGSTVALRNVSDDVSMMPPDRTNSAVTGILFEPGPI